MGKLHAYVGTVTSGGTNGDRISEGPTTVSAGVTAGTAYVDAVDITKLQGLTKLMVGTGANKEIMTIQTIVGNRVNFTGALTKDHTSGETLHYPLFASLNANGGEQKTIAIALRTDTGYITSGNITLDLVDVLVDANDQTLKFALAPDNAGLPGAFGAWGADLVLTNPAIGNTNKLFHAKIMCTDNETLQNDVSVKLNVTVDIVSAS